MLPTLIVHGDADTTVPVHQSEKLCQVIKNCRLEIMKGADHRYTKDSDFEKKVALVSEFVVGEVGAKIRQK